MSLDQILLIPGIGGKSVVQETRELLFGSSQAGGMWYPFIQSSVWADTSATTPITDNTGAARIDDLSGNGKNATQSTGGLRPTWRNNDGVPKMICNGTDSGMVTDAIDFTGTDSITVFAAVRKLSDAAIGSICELSATWASNNGAFSLQASNGAADNYISTSRGDAAPGLPLVATASGYAAPVTNVITAIFDISSDTNQLRLNGSLIASAVGNQGAGNFGNYVLYMFRRNGATLPFNGQVFALIVAGGSYSAATISRVEKLLSRYTPGVSL